MVLVPGTTSRPICRQPRRCAATAVSLQSSRSGSCSSYSSSELTICTDKSKCVGFAAFDDEQPTANLKEPSDKTSKAPRSFNLSPVKTESCNSSNNNNNSVIEDDSIARRTASRLKSGLGIELRKYIDFDPKGLDNPSTSGCFTAQAVVSAPDKSRSDVTTSNTAASTIAKSTDRKRSPDDGRCGSCVGCRLKSDCGRCASCKQNVLGCLARQCSSSFNIISGTLPEALDARIKNSKKPKNEENSAAAATAALKEEPERGTLVYGRWPENDKWYWGQVVQVKTVAKSFGRCEKQYDILFHDGDFRKSAPREDFETEADYLSFFPDKREEVQKINAPYAAKVQGKKKKPPISKGEICIGARCYSKFTTGSWHWGVITKVEGEGINMKCSVLFDDGDTRDKVRCYDELYLKSDLGIVFHSNADYEASRCGKCARCILPDCGECRSCVTNKNSTTTTKECCSFRFCLLLNVECPVPKFPKGWKYTLVENGTRPNHASPLLHPMLDGFRVIGPRNVGRTFFDLEEAGVFLDLPITTIRDAEKEIFVQDMGLKIRSKEQHVLVGKSFVWQWVKGKHESGAAYDSEVVYGIIDACERDRFDEPHKLLFKVKYTHTENSSGSKRLMSVVGIPALALKFNELTEREAWGGCLLYAEKRNRKRSPVHDLLAETNCVPLRWFIPDKTEYTDMEPCRRSRGHCRPRQVSWFRSTRLEFEARKSTIPNAGLGVFLLCTHVGSEPRDNFRLENGELLDFGIYAPLGSNDVKDGSLFLFKNFIFDGDCEGWSFDSYGCRTVFDITDDLTGDLHDVAERNLPAYVNETDGKHKPSVRAAHDPRGSVHYLLGHYETEEGPLIFPFNTWVELKIDYGPAYEPVRVRKGYSRLSLVAQEKEKMRIENDSKECLRDIGSWSVNDVELCICYVEKLRLDDMAEGARANCLIITIVLCLRLLEVKKEFSSCSRLRKEKGSAATAHVFCDNGYSTMHKKKLLLRAKKCILELMSFWKEGAYHEDKNMQEVLLGQDYCAFYVAELLTSYPATLKAMNPSAFRAAIKTHVSAENY